MPHGGPIPRVRSDADASLPSIPVSVRALLTGGSGFVGTHLQAVLRDAGDTVLLSEADITDRTALLAEFGAAEPDVVYHLAAQADVGGSWTEPVETFRVNAEGTLNVLDAARLAGARRVLAPRNVFMVR